MNYSKGVNSRVLRWVISAVIIILFNIWNPTMVFAGTTGNNDVGIEFNKEEESSSSEPAISSSYEIAKSRPVTKATGLFPQTGELLQPVIYFLVGLLFLVLIVALYVSKKSVEGKSK